MKRAAKKIWLLVFSLAIPLLIGFLGSTLTTPNIPTWFVCLEKPFFSPPNWLFAPVWTILFILMGLALFLVLRDGRKNRYFEDAILVFGAQLILNLYWSFFFFFIHSPLLAFYDIIILWLMIALNIYCFYKIKKTAAYLLIPYIVWVSFAAILNYSIWFLN
jgi:tryptophan-rich sensory protein